MTLSPIQKQVNAFSELADTSAWSARNDTLESMEKLYGSIDHASKEGIVLCFALASIYDQLGETDSCFKLLEEGNRHHRVGKTDTIEDARYTVKAVKQLFDNQSVNRLSSSDKPQLMFIVGMPRSGTTLVEQILASHSRVHGGGELKLMGQWCFGYLKLYGDYGEAAPLDNYLSQLQQHYLNGIRELTDKSVVTDKMPLNFLWTGFILSAFPQAKVIHTIRDPMAVCWSLYRTPFAGTSNGYACDLEDIGEFYNLYQDLMHYWHKKFPGEIHDLHYERLTEQQTEETARLLEYCELSWEDACLQFHKNPRKVKTVSKHQVRKPMYQGSSEAWKQYENYLRPLSKILKPGQPL